MFDERFIKQSFLVIGIAELLSGAAEKAKKRRCARDRVSNRDKAGEPADRNAPLVVGDEKLSSAIRGKNYYQKQ